MASVVQAAEFVAAVTAAPGTTQRHCQAAGAEASGRRGEASGAPGDQPRLELPGAQAVEKAPLYYFSPARQPPSKVASASFCTRGHNKGHRDDRTCKDGTAAGGRARMPRLVRLSPATPHPRFSPAAQGAGGKMRTWWQEEGRAWDSRLRQEPHPAQVPFRQDPPFPDRGLGGTPRAVRVEASTSPTGLRTERNHSLWGGEGRLVRQL